MSQLFHRMFEFPGFRIGVVLLLVSGMLVGQERRPPVLNGGVQQQERRRPVQRGEARQQDELPDQYSVLKMLEDECQQAREALDLYRAAAANPDLVLSDRWSQVEDRAYQALASCFSCPMGTLKIGIELLRRAQIVRPNPQARAEVYRRLIQLTSANDPPRRPVSLPAFDQAVQRWKQRIQEILREAEECFQQSCVELLQVLEDPNPRRRGDASRRGPITGGVNRTDRDSETRNAHRDPLGLPSASADTPDAPEIIYKPDCRRSLVFINNPEQIRPEDLADASLGHKHIYETRISGAARIFFEHTNRTGYPIGYDIQLVNPGERAVRVTIQGKGFTSNVFGGEPFRQVFEQEKARNQEQVITIDRKKFVWLCQSAPSENPRSPTIPNRAFLSGVVDLEVQGGEVVIKAMGYRNSNDLDGKSTAEGYITRIDTNPSPPPTDESRMYKGVMDCAEVIAEGVNFTIDDSTPDGPLDVRFRSRNGQLNEPQEWHTHSVTNPAAIQGDMMDIRMPGGTILRADGKDEQGRLPNIGNWGVVYTLKGKVTNNGNQTRCVSVNLQLTSPTEKAVIAWRDRGGIWHQKQLLAQGRIAYYEFSVPAGQAVPYEAKLVLGGPSSTNLLNRFSLAGKKQPCPGSW